MSKKFIIGLLCFTLVFVSGCSHKITATSQLTPMEKTLFPENVGLAFDQISQTTPNFADNETLKEEIYTILDTYDHDSSEWYGVAYGTPSSYVYPNTYALIAPYGIEGVPYILQYILDHPVAANDIETESYDQRIMLCVAYELLNVKGYYEIHWFSSSGRYTPVHLYLLAQDLLDYINENGLRPIYPFLSAEEAATNQDRITRQLELSDNDFNWYLTKDFTRYQSYADLVTVFGEYAVPYVLDYILSYEGKDLTPDEEMNLGVLLHLSYHMLGVETTARWHMPAEPVASTTDPFPYAHELVAHLGEYGLEPVPHE